MKQIYIPANEDYIIQEPEGEVVETIGQAWCLCPYEWGMEDCVKIESSQGVLVLCNVVRVVGNSNWSKIQYRALTKKEMPVYSKSREIF